MVLPERPEDQPRDVVAGMMRLTTMDETWVREHLAIMSSADALNAWERIRAHERATGTRISRPEDLPDPLVREIQEFSGLQEEVVRRYLAVRHVMNSIGAWDRLAPASAAVARLQQWRVRLAFGRPLPPWARDLIEEIGVEDSERALATRLIAATIALVGGGEAEVHGWLAESDPGVDRTRVDVVRNDGWEALDDMLLRAYDRETNTRATR